MGLDSANEIQAHKGLPASFGGWEPIQLPTEERRRPQSAQPAISVDGQRTNAPVVEETSIPESEEKSLFLSWIARVVDIGTKANENIVAVNSVDGGIVHPGITLRLFLDTLREFIPANFVSLPQEVLADVQKIVDILLQQNLRTGYNPDAVSEQLQKLRDIRV